jgi:DNA-binding CsgD family transcriptional regulator
VVARWPLVGRAQELAELRRLLGADAPSRGVALFGEAGVGKTRLVDEAVDAEREAGASVEWVRATEAAREIPLGSFAHVLAPDEGAHQPDDLLHLALTGLRDRAGDGPFLLAVDDAHLLDEVSIALVHLALTQSPVRVLLSVRTGEPVPQGLVGLWKDELLARLDVGPLAREATEELVVTVLGDGVPASLLDRIWQLSHGNVLFVRELVTIAVERRATGAGGRIVLTAGTKDRLHDLVEERLRLIEPERRAALEVVAMGEQVPLAAAERLIDPADIDALERRGLVEVVGAGETEMLQVVHPLHREVLAAGLPRLRRRALLRDLVEAVGDLDSFDRLRIATWRLESGDPGEPDQLLVLAREALGRFDHRLAERLAVAAGGTARADAGLILGMALAGQGRIGESEAALAVVRPADPEAVAQVALARAANLFLQLDRSTDAYEVLKVADEDLAGYPVWQAECRSVLAQMLMFSFRLHEAGQIAEDLLTDPDAPETARLRAAPVAMTVRSAAGHLDAGMALLDDDLDASARRHRREVPYAEVQLGMARFQALYWAGRIREIDAFTADDLGLRVEHPPPSLRGIIAGFRGGALLVRGRAHAALGELQRSCRALSESDWFGQRPLAESMRARAAVFAGDQATAEEAIAAADAAYAADMLRGARTLPYIELSRAWVSAAEGARAEAAQRCLALATALERNAKPLAVEAGHAAARLGRAAESVDLLERLAASVDGPLAPVVARHARALASGDPDALAAVGDEFAELGADLLAAEALRAASNAYRRAGRGASASTAARRVDELLEACGQPSSPALEAVAVVGEELTERERQVAVLAARGRTSPEIAEALYLSVRTVDTHLHRVYRKLMIEGRHELPEAMGIAAPPPGSAGAHST